MGSKIRAVISNLGCTVNSSDAKASAQSQIPKVGLTSVFSKYSHMTFFWFENHCPEITVTRACLLKKLFGGESESELLT
jgi:hypothetical protein